MADITTSENMSREKKWGIKEHGAVIARHKSNDVGQEREVSICVGSRSVCLATRYLDLYIEALGAAKKWLEEE